MTNDKPNKATDKPCLFYEPAPKLVIKLEIDRPCIHCGRLKSRHLPLDIEGREVLFCHHSETTCYVPAPEPEIDEQLSPAQVVAVGDAVNLEALKESHAELLSALKEVTRVIEEGEGEILNPYVEAAEVAIQRAEGISK